MLLRPSLLRRVLLRPMLLKPTLLWPIVTEANCYLSNFSCYHKVGIAIIIIVTIIIWP